MTVATILKDAKVYGIDGAPLSDTSRLNSVSIQTTEVNEGFATVTACMFTHRVS